MTGFLLKELEDRTLSETFRMRRAELGLSLEDVERETGVAKKHVETFERGAFAELPEAVYARKFARRLAERYGLEPEAAVQQLLREMSVVHDAPPIARHPVTFVQGRSPLASPHALKTGLIAGFFLAIVGYFGYSVHHILKPPELTLYSPLDNQVFSSPRMALEGLTEPEVDLTVNGEPVFIEANGTFKDIMSLPPGVSHLRIAAKKKHSREREILLKVVIDVPEMPGASATSTEETSENLPESSATDAPPARTPPSPSVTPPPAEESGSGTEAAAEVPV